MYCGVLLSGRLHAVAIDSTRSLNTSIYTNAFRTLCPRLLIGFMFLAVAFASRSAADSELRNIEKTLTARTATPEDLREEISLHAGVTTSSPIKANLITGTEAGLRKLNNPEVAAIATTQFWCKLIYETMRSRNCLQARDDETAIV